MKRSSEMNRFGTLYLVGVPIGNFDDATFRMINTLKEVDHIYCEDTRITARLLSHFEIKNHLDTYSLINEHNLTPKLIEKLKEGKNLAIVTDAGLPAISDPGYLAVREAVKEDIKVEVIPSATAFATAVAGSAIPCNNFLFIGFLPPKKGDRIKKLNTLKDLSFTLIFYEAPHRIEETIADLYEVLGKRSATIARELTKTYEEYIYSDLDELASTSLELKGEMVIVVEGCKEETKELDIKELYAKYKELGLSKKDIIQTIVTEYNIPKNKVYNEIKGEE